MFCEHCGAQNQEGSKFCASCGKPINNKNTENTGNGKQQEKKRGSESDRVKLPLREYISLYKMALKPEGFSVALYFAIMIFLTFWMVMFVIGIAEGTIVNRTYMRTLFLEILLFLIYAFLVSRVRKSTFDPKRRKYTRYYKKSVWLHNTGILPSEIVKDTTGGLWGEYVTTVNVEINLKRNGNVGRIFNNVMVPKKNGDFTEIDLVYVNETGIHVIETKDRKGIFRGNLSDQTWTQELGSDQNQLENPFLQNQNHCNFLMEYLWENCPKNERETLCHMRNVVLFANDYADFSKINYDERPVLYYGRYIAQVKSYRLENFKKDWRICLNEKQIEIIGDLIEEISFIPKDVRQRKIQERLYAYEQGRFTSRYKYYVVHVNENSDMPYKICREDRYYKTYKSSLHGFFECIPWLQVRATGPAHNDLSSAVRDYRNLAYDDKEYYGRIFGGAKR